MIIKVNEEGQLFVVNQLQQQHSPNSCQWTRKEKIDRLSHYRLDTYNETFRIVLRGLLAAFYKSAASVNVKNRTKSKRGGLVVVAREHLRDQIPDLILRFKLTKQHILSPTQSLLLKIHLHTHLKWFWEPGWAVSNCTSTVARPGDKLLEEISDVFDKWEASFKGLKGLRRMRWKDKQCCENFMLQHQVKQEA